MKKEEKTNVMRVLDSKKVNYKKHNYLSTGAVSGIEVAEALGENPDMVLKRWLLYQNQGTIMCLWYRLKRNWI